MEVTTHEQCWRQIFNQPVKTATGTCRASVPPEPLTHVLPAGVSLAQNRIRQNLNMSKRPEEATLPNQT